MNPERCIVRVYKKYATECPNDVIGGSVFYLTPKWKWSAGDEIWFTHSPIGNNSLRSVVADMSRKANFGGYYHASSFVKGYHVYLSFSKGGT